MLARSCRAGKAYLKDALHEAKIRHLLIGELWKKCESTVTSSVTPCLLDESPALFGLAQAELSLAPCKHGSVWCVQEARFKEFRLLYDIVKNERNRCTDFPIPT